MLVYVFIQDRGAYTYENVRLVPCTFIFVQEKKLLITMHLLCCITVTYFHRKSGDIDSSYFALLISLGQLHHVFHVIGYLSHMHF